MPQLAPPAGQLITLTHVLVIGVGLAGVLLIPAPGGPSDPLHARVYGPTMLLVLGAAWVSRTPDPRRNMGIFAVACGFVGLLALRALTTA